MSPAPAAAGLTGGARRTAWSHAAAACSLVLSGLQLGLLASGVESQAYLVVVLLLSAVTSGLAGACVAVRNCVVSRVLAATVATGALAAVLLVSTVGTPGSAGPEPLGPAGAIAAGLGLAIPVLLAADAVRGSVRRARW